MGLETLRTLYSDFTDSREFKQLSYSDIKTLDSRVSRLIKSGLESPSLENLQDSVAGKKFISAKGYFSASKFNKVLEKANAGDKKAQLQIEETYKAISSFVHERKASPIYDNDGNVIGMGEIPADTSTVKGARDFEKEISERIPGYDKLTKTQKKNLWKVYDDMKQYYHTNSKEDSTRYQQLVMKVAELEGLKFGQEGNPVKDRLNAFVKYPEFMEKWKNKELTDEDIREALKRYHKEHREAKKNKE